MQYCILTIVAQRLYRCSSGHWKEACINTSVNTLILHFFKFKGLLQIKHVCFFNWTGELHPHLVQEPHVSQAIYVSFRSKFMGNLTMK